MTKKADIGSKRLISLDPQAWSCWVTGNPRIEFADLLDSEFQWISRHGDVLIRAWDPDMGEFLIANEIQLRYSTEMPRRMRLYTALVEEKFKLPVYPVLVVILPESETIPTYYQSRLGGLEARQDYKVIQLSEVEAKVALSQPIPSLLPFVPIMQGGEQESVIREALRLLQQDPVLSELEPLLAFFARFVLSSEVVTEILRWDMAVLRESPWYEEIKQEGIQLGKQEAVPILAELGLSVDEIAQRLGLPREQVAQLLRS
jgi:predicted transposase YdaD